MGVIKSRYIYSTDRTRENSSNDERAESELSQSSSKIGNPPLSSTMRGPGDLTLEQREALLRKREESLREAERRAWEEDDNRSRYSEDGRQKDAGASGTAEAQRSVVVGPDDSWRYATPRQSANPGDLHIIKLIREKWGQGQRMNPFVINPFPNERSYDWKLYAEELESAIALRGEASQWQKALFVSASVGPGLHEYILTHQWLSKKPLEGEMHYDLLMERIAAYYDSYQDSMVALKRFKDAKQGENEPFAVFYERLQKLRRICGMKPDNPLIRMYLLEGARDDAIRQHANAAAHDFTCENLVSMGTRFENERNQAKAKAKQEAEVLAVHQEPPRAKLHTSESFGQSKSEGFRGYSMSGAGQSRGYRGREARQMTTGQYASGGNRGRAQQPSNIRPFAGRTGQGGRDGGGDLKVGPMQPGCCRNCGWMHGASDYCAALNKTCDLCKKLGHFQRCCRTHGQPKDNVQVAQNNN